jgi:hypothetical protein
VKRAETSLISSTVLRLKAAGAAQGQLASPALRACQAVQPSFLHPGHCLALLNLKLMVGLLPFDRRRVSKVAVLPFGGFCAPSGGSGLGPGGRRRRLRDILLAHLILPQPGVDERFVNLLACLDEAASRNRMNRQPHAGSARRCLCLCLQRGGGEDLRLPRIDLSSKTRTGLLFLS